MILDNLISFVETNGYQDKPFSEVLKLYEKEMQEIYNDMHEEELREYMQELYY